MRKFISKKNISQISNKGIVAKFTNNICETSDIKVIELLKTIEYIEEMKEESNELKGRKRSNRNN